jgi:ketosteroid isomerase-like protein
MRIAPILLFTAAFAQAGDLERGKAVLMKADREFAADTARRGVDGFADWMAERDILKFQARGAPLTTREQVRADMRKAFEGRPFTLRWDPVTADIAASGELGYTFGRWTSEGKGPDGKLREIRGYYFTVWKRQSDGSWKVVVDFGNPE